MASEKFCLFVGRLPWTISGDVLKSYFARFGNVSSAVVKFDKQTGLSRGFGFVVFKNREAYTNALSQQTHKIDGATITVATPSSRQTGPRLIDKFTEELPVTGE